MGDRLPRKLAAVLYADVAEYSRLTGEDEDSTHRTLSEYLDVIAGMIQSHHGEVMHYAGDAVLAKFDAVVDAMSSAIDIQDDLYVRNSKLEDKRKVRFRIGVNSGDIIEDRGDIYGDGVNIAARLEALADPGGICISDPVRIAIGNKLGLSYEDLGDQQVKNIAAAVRAFKVVTEYSVEKANQVTDSGALGLPDAPSIAVLPFTNMSNDPEQEYFSDGISEDIITALSKISAMVVIARSSTFIYKGKAVDIKQVGREQGVRYVLEGSVRKAGNQIRIIAQLIDATTGQHEWAERYDRQLEDIFAVQDEITKEVVSAIDVRLLAGQQANLWSSSTKNVKAWEKYRLARNLLDQYRAEDIPEIKKLLSDALAFDPGYAAAWATLGSVNFHIAEDARYQKEDRARSLDLTRDYAEKALAFDPSFGPAYADLALYHLSLKNYDEALNNAFKAEEQSPNNAFVIGVSAVVLNKCGESQSAYGRIQKAMRICPVYPLWYLTTLGQITRVLRDVDKASDAYSEVISRDPDHLEGHIGLTNILGESDRIDEARQAASHVLRLNPSFSISEYVSNLSYRDESEIERFADGLRKAGLPG